MRRQNILISGGLGYVGGRLCSYFSEKSEYNVFALTRSKTLQDYNTDIEVLSNEDVLNENRLENIKIDVFIHLAAMNEKECVQDHLKCNEININGTLKWLEWAKNKGVSKFIYFSTVHVYDKPLRGFYSEESNAFPAHPYSISHKCAEDYVLLYYHEHNLEVAIVRLSNSFGYPAFSTANRWTLFINDICKQAVKTGNINIYSNILQVRDFISLSNVCRAIDLLINYEIPDTDNRIFNLSKGHSDSLIDIAKLVQRVTQDYFKKKVDIVYDKKKQNEVTSLIISNEKLKGIGWEPTTKNDETEIKKTLEFFRN